MYSLSPNTKKEFIPCGLLYPMKPKGLEDAEQALTSWTHVHGCYSYVFTDKISVLILYAQNFSKPQEKKCVPCMQGYTAVDMQALQFVSSNPQSTNQHVPKPLHFEGMQLLVEAKSRCYKSMLKV
jgi:hypothetical protein